MIRPSFSLLVRLLLILLLLGVFPLVVLWIVAVQPTVVSNDPSDVEVSPQVLEAHVRMLSETFHPRNSLNHENQERTVAYLTEEFARAGAEISYQEIPHIISVPRNVIATFDRGKESWLIVGAHYDSYSSTPGADDNASGVAVLLELAQLIDASTWTDVNVELVAFNLEEPPYFGTQDMGSYVHAKELAASGRDVIGMICFDMVGFYSEAPGSQTYPIPALKAVYPDTGDYIAVIGRLDQRGFTLDVKQGMKGVTPLPVYSVNAPTVLQGVDYSDHRNYWEFGYNAVMITNTAFYRNEHYHQATDTADRLDYERMSQVTVAVYEMLKTL